MKVKILGGTNQDKSGNYLGEKKIRKPGSKTHVLQQYHNSTPMEKKFGPEQV